MSVSGIVILSAAKDLFALRDRGARESANFLEIP